MSDLTSKILFGLFLIIPAVGAYQYAKVYNQKTEPRLLSVSELYDSNPREDEQCELDRFKISEAPIERWRYEFAIAEATDFDPKNASFAGLNTTLIYDLFGESPESEFEFQVVAPKVILRRKKLLEGSLADRVAAGKIDGMISSKLSMSWEHAGELGLPVDKFGPNSYWIVDVDRDHIEESLNGIMLATFFLSAAGIIMLFFVLNTIHSKKFDKSLRHESTRAQVALQVHLSKQATCRY